MYHPLQDLEAKRIVKERRKRADIAPKIARRGRKNPVLFRRLLTGLLTLIFRR